MKDPLDMPTASTASTSVASIASDLAMAGDAALFTAVTIVAGPLSLLIGPTAAWLLHGRRLNRAAAISLAVGVVAGLVVVGGVLLVLVGIGWAIGPLGGSEFTYPIVLLAVASILFLAGLVALIVDAVRDLAPARRRHVRLDVARLVATAALAVGVAAMTVIQTRNPATEVGDAGVFALAAGSVAGVAMRVGGRVHERWTKQRTAPGT